MGKHSKPMNKRRPATVAATLAVAVLAGGTAWAARPDGLGPITAVLTASSPAPSYEQKRIPPTPAPARAQTSPSPEPTRDENSPSTQPEHTDATPGQEPDTPAPEPSTPAPEPTETPAQSQASASGPDEPSPEPTQAQEQEQDESPSPEPTPSPATPEPRRTTPAPEKTSPAPEKTSPRVISSGTCQASFHEEDQGTASGERFNPSGMTAAHRTLPFGSRVRVTNPATGASVTVRVNDRGPFVAGRCLDLTPAAFARIAALDTGVVKVTYEVLES